MNYFVVIGSKRNRVNLLNLFLFSPIKADKTNKWFGVKEMLIATSMNGVIFGLFSGQPLMITGPTGPFLVFEGFHSLLFSLRSLRLICPNQITNNRFNSFVFSLFFFSPEMLYLVSFFRTSVNYYRKPSPIVPGGNIRKVLLNSIISQIYFF